MPTPKFFEQALGWWEGESALSLPWDRPEPYLSLSSLHVDLGPKGAYAQIEYRWSFKETLQNGVLLVAGDKPGGEISVGWVDSWHQSPSVMTMKGTWSNEESIKVIGSYSAGEGPPWGWRFELGLKGETLHFEMTNIHPDGKEDWAVRCDYKRN